MANKYWLGGAAPIKQTRTYTFNADGTAIEANDIIRVTIGQRVYDFVAGATAIDTAVASLVTSWTALSSTLFPEFYEVIPTYNSTSNVLTLTARTEGVNFTVTLRPYESDGTTPATDMTIEGSNAATTGTAGVANSSPNDGSVAANWSGGTAPANNDTIIFANNAIDLLDGLDFSSINLSVTVRQSYTGKIGRPVTNSGGYPEYRLTHLTVGADDTDPQYITIGQGVGAGSGRVKINVGGSTSHVVIHNAGTPADAGMPAVQIKGGDSSSTFTAAKGIVGLAIGPYDIAAAAEETASFGSLSVGYVTNPSGDADIRCGSGVTLPVIDQSGGKLLVKAGATTITKTGGELTLDGGVTGTAVTVTTLNERGGTTYVTGVTTITTANLSNSGVLDYSRDMRTKAITNPVNVYGDKAKFIDPFKVTGSVVVDCEQGGALANLDLGEHFSITRGSVS